MEQEFDLYSDETVSFADRRAGHGILIITLSGQILWTDSRAADLCQQMRFVTGEKEDTLPLEVMKIAKEVAELLELRSHTKDWEAFNIRRAIKAREGHVFVAAIGMPAGVGHNTESTVFFTLDVISARKSVNRMEEFQLTPREITVVGSLLKGLPNKEIAQAINVSVQTAKEHIKHIMEKTGTNTRTGIIVALAAPPENALAR